MRAAILAVLALALAGCDTLRGARAVPAAAIPASMLECRTWERPAPGTMRDQVDAAEAVVDFEAAYRDCRDKLTVVRDLSGDGR